MKNLTKTILLFTSVGIGLTGLSLLSRGLSTEAEKLYREKNNQVVIEDANRLKNYGDALRGISLLIPPFAGPLIVYRHMRRSEKERKLNLNRNYKWN